MVGVQVCVGSTCVQASPGSIEVQYALAPPAATCTPDPYSYPGATSSDSAEGAKARGSKGVRPSPAHLVMTAHAMVYGCVAATAKSLVSSGPPWHEGWSQVSSVSLPVSCYPSPPPPLPCKLSPLLSCPACNQSPSLVRGEKNQEEEEEEEDLCS